MSISVSFTFLFSLWVPPDAFPLSLTFHRAKVFLFIFKIVIRNLTAKAATMVKLDMLAPIPGAPSYLWVRIAIISLIPCPSWGTLTLPPRWANPKC